MNMTRGGYIALITKEKHYQPPKVDDLMRFENGKFGQIFFY